MVLSGKIKHISTSGLICLGDELHCDDGKPSDLNLVAKLDMSYKTSRSGNHWLLTSKISNVNLQKAVAVMSGDRSLKMPEILGNIGLSPFQPGCKANSDIDDCFFLVAVSNQDIAEPDGLSVALVAGLTITAKINFVKPAADSKSLKTSSSLLHVVYPFHGNNKQGRCCLLTSCWLQYLLASKLRAFHEPLFPS